MSTLGSVVLRDVIANRPAASIPGRMFYSTDTNVAYRDNGSSWDTVVSNTSAASIDLETDGTPNGDQTKLNLVAGTNITLSDDGTGDVTITAAGGTAPSGSANQVYATPDGSAGSASLRALVPADVPTLNQSTSGNAATATTAANATAVGGITVTGTPTTGQVLTATSGTAADWQTPSASGGTVTSVAMTVPSRQTITGSPITASGTLAITDNNQNANLVFAGPSTGAAAAPTFRTLAPADLPVATTSALGAVKPDGTTITVTGGTISAAAATPNLTIGFILNTGATGTNVGPMIPAARTATLTRVVVVTKASDASVPFQFDIRKNGTSIFTGTLPTVSAGTSSGTVSVFTGLTSNPLSVTQDDVFSIDVIQGNSNWVVTVQAET